MRESIDRARRWLGASPNRSIFGAAMTIAILTLIAKVASLGKDLAVASMFGTSDAVDAFLIALLLPTFAINVVANSLNAAFVAVFVECREQEGLASAAKLFEGVLVLSILVLGVVTVALGALSAWLLPHLAPTFAPEKMALTKYLFLLLLPTVFLSGMATVYTGALNAGEQFALGAVAPIAVPVLSLVAILGWGPTLGIKPLAFGTVLGYLANAVIVARAVSAAGLGVVPRWHGWTPAMRKVLSQYLPVASGACLMSSSVLVDQAMASVLPSGSVAALSYGSKTIVLITNLGTMALGTAVLPHFSRMVAQADWRAFRHTLKTYIRFIVMTTVPLTVILALASTTIVRLVFQRGAFTSADTASVGLVQAMFLLQVPFYTLGILFVRSLTAMQRNGALFWGNVISFPLNAALNWVGMRWMGVPGIALSTSIVYGVSCMYLWLMVHRSLAAVQARSVVAAPLLSDAMAVELR